MAFLFKLDDDGNVLEKEAKGPGRPPLHYRQEVDGNFYYCPPRASEQLRQQIKQLVASHPVKPSKRVRTEDLSADQKTTAERIVRSCHSLEVRRNNGTITLIRPIVVGMTGVVEIDDIEGQPIFHKIEIDKETCCVTVWSVSSPASPIMVVRNVLLGDQNAVEEQE